MSYFLLKEKQNLSNVIKPHFDYVENVFWGNSDILFDFKDEMKPDLKTFTSLDFFRLPTFIINDNMLKSIQIFEDIMYRSIYYGIKNSNYYYQGIIVNPQTIDCIHVASIQKNNMLITKPILNKEKLSDKNLIFQIAHSYQRFLIVELKLLEDFLMNGNTLVDFEELEII